MSVRQQIVVYARPVKVDCHFNGFVTVVECKERSSGAVDYNVVNTLRKEISYTVRRHTISCSDRNL